MNTILTPEYIECRFSDVPDSLSQVQLKTIEVYFSEMSDLIDRYEEFTDIISDDEKIRARKFVSDANRETYICSHAVLRLILAKHLNSDPSEISFITGKYSKPFLEGNPVHFNISHTGNAFAIIVSSNFNVGIDIEEVDHRTDIWSVAESYFSKQERDYLHDSKERENETFYLLWTRKESLLKALGTGIPDNLNKVEVSGQLNRIDKNIFEGISVEGDIFSLFLYSMKIKNYYISFASSGKSPISFTQLAGESVSACLF